MKFLYFVGTAGSGKSTLVKAYKDWLDCAEISSMIVNLDPGSDTLPYEASVDIREWISLGDVMSEYKLGPNGAQIVATDLMAVNIKKITDILDVEETDYVLMDTPGQLELFAFRQSSDVIINAFGKDRSAVVYLVDPALCKTPNGFVSNMVLSSLVQFRLNLPMINVVTKLDVLSKEEEARITNWFEDLDILHNSLLEDDSDSQTIVGMELYKALESIGVFGEIHMTSAIENVGLEDIYRMTGLSEEKI
ncbi:MAG: ATP/GTP-binding protein [archaeon]|nr:ATP/GTP-binding protein [archaeon]